MKEKPKKAPVGRPRQIPVYETGKKAQDNFLGAMKAVLQKPRKDLR